MLACPASLLQRKIPAYAGMTARLLINNFLGDDPNLKRQKVSSSLYASVPVALFLAFPAVAVKFHFVYYSVKTKFTGDFFLQSFHFCIFKFCDCPTAYTYEVVVMVFGRKGFISCKVICKDPLSSKT